MNIITFHLLAEFTSVIIKALKEGQMVAYQELYGGVAFIVISVGSSERAGRAGTGALASSSLTSSVTCSSLVVLGLAPTT